MKKKLFRSFIVSLFVFTLFISVSNAEIVANKNYVIKTPTLYYPQDVSVSSMFPDYTTDSFITMLNDFKNNPSESTFQVIYDLFDAKGFSCVCASIASTNNSLTVFAYSNDLHDIGIGMDSNDSPSYLLCVPKDIDTRYEIRLAANNSMTFQSTKAYSDTLLYHLLTNSSTYTVYYKIPGTVKKLSYVESKTYSWDGVSYYTQSQPKPEIPAGPEFSTELTDDEIASVVQNFSNSTYWKNRESKFTHFFIQRNERNGNYAVFMVPYNLVKDDSIDWLYIPSGISSSNYNALDYDSYCILWHDGAYIPDIPLSLANLKYKTYLSYDGINFDYSGEVHVNELDDYRIPMTTPIIYSTFPLNFKTLLGDKVNDSGNTVDSFTEETPYDLADLTNSETGESYVFEEIPIETDPVVSALREIFQELFAFIESLLNAIFDFSEYLLHQFGANAFTLIFAIVIEAFSALVAGISLLVRFAGFVLTLVAIPADASLFNVLVDGSAWGTHFIEGLNFLKGLSWNNLNLWTFFECFVAALEVIWIVRIVRRHYSQVV